MALFSAPRRFGSTPFLFRTWYPVVIEEDTQRAVARHRLEVWLWVLLDKISHGPATSSTTGVWHVLCHILSRAEVMRECDIHHTRAIKTNSAVDLSRKPGLDFCCDLLQQLQEVPRTCSFIIVRTSICSSHHSNCLSCEINEIQFLYYMDGIFAQFYFNLF